MTEPDEKSWAPSSSKTSRGSGFFQLPQTGTDPQSPEALLQEIIQLRTRLEIENAIERILWDLDDIGTIGELFAYILEKLPLKLECRARFHFIDMGGYFHDQTDESRRSAHVNDLWEIFRSGLSSYLSMRYGSAEAASELDFPFDIHSGDLVDKRDGRDYFPIIIENSTIGRESGLEIDTTIGYAEIPWSADWKACFVDPRAQIHKIMRSIRAHLERIQSMLLLEERTRLACEDPLTGLWNRRGFFESITRLRRKTPKAHYAVITLDLDHFKKVNDTYGHEGGDEALRHVSERLQEMVLSHPWAIPARFWGEEFVVYCHGWTREDSLALAENIRSAIAATAISIWSHAVPITASLWVTESGSSEERIKDAIDRADIAMYRAKEGGRNRVEFCQPQPVKFQEQAIEPATSPAASNRRVNWLSMLEETLASEWI